MSTGIFYGVGLGPGDPGLLTLKAIDALRKAEVIYTVGSRCRGKGVSTLILDSIKDLTSCRVELKFAMKLSWPERLKLIRQNAGLIASELQDGRDCAFACIGDPLTYGTCGYLQEELKNMIPGLKIEIIPGVNSWSALAASAGTELCADLEGLRIIPSYQVLSESKLDEILDSGDTLVFLKTYRSRNELVEMLKKRKRDILYGANIGLKEQFICTEPEKITDRDLEYLSMVIVKPEQVKHL